MFSSRKLLYNFSRIFPEPESIWLNNMYKGLNETKSWNLVDDLNSNNLKNKLKEFIKYNSHTEESYLWCIDKMKYINNYGLTTFHKAYFNGYKIDIEGYKQTEKLIGVDEIYSEFADEYFNKYKMKILMDIDRYLETKK